jgi:hypothetical protein
VELVEGNARGGEIVHQAGEIAGETRRIGSGSGDEERLTRADLQNIAADRLAPGERQLRQLKMAREARDRLREDKEIGIRLGGNSEQVILLVDIADGADDGKDRRLAAELRDEDLAECADGAARRQQDGKIGEGQRVRGGEIDEAARKDRIGQRREKRRAGRDVEDSGAGPPGVHRLMRRCRRSTIPLR